jgi:hypothetical protein
MARVTTHVLPALTEVVMDTSLCPKQNISYVLSNGGDLGHYFLVFSFVCLACTSNESKSLQNFTHIFASFFTFYQFLSLSIQGSGKKNH